MSKKRQCFFPDRPLATKLENSSRIDHFIFIPHEIEFLCGKIKCPRIIHESNHIIPSSAKLR
jgi:hypothetical protein